MKCTEQIEIILMPEKVGNKYSWNVLPEKTVTNTVTSILHDKKKYLYFFVKKSTLQTEPFLMVHMLCTEIKAKRNKRGSARRVEEKVTWGKAGLQKTAGQRTMSGQK